MAFGVRERTGHKGVNRHRYVHLPVNERGHDRRNSHMGFLLLVFPIIAGGFWAVAHVLAGYHDSFVDNLFGGTPSPALALSHRPVTSVKWVFSAWSPTSYYTGNWYAIKTQTSYIPQDPISAVPRVGGALPGGGLFKRDISPSHTTYEPSQTLQHFHPYPAQHHVHQQPMATGMSTSTSGSDEDVVIHDGWKIPGQEKLPSDTIVMTRDRRESPNALHKYHLHSSQLRKNSAFRRLLDNQNGTTSDLEVGYSDITFTRVLWAIYGFDHEIKVNLISLQDLAQLYEASLRFELPELGAEVLPDLLADIGERFIWRKESKPVFVDVLSFLDLECKNPAFHQKLRDAMRHRAIEFSERFPDELGALTDLCPNLCTDLVEH